MTENKIGSIPDFTSDEGQGVPEEVKPTEEVVAETETPAELPAESGEPEQKPVEEVTLNDDGGNTAKQVQGLQDEREKLLNEIKTLRGERRELKKDELIVVDKKIQEVSDELKDIAPDDVNLIDRVLRAKGYMTKEESSKMHYDAVKNEEVTKFLDKFPEYKPENDANDLNWNALQRQVQSWYRMPGDPRLVGELLVKAHKDIARTPVGQNLEVKKQQLKVASSGAAGVQRSSPKPANSRLSDLMRTHMQGWSEEEISNLEKKLPE